MGQGAWPGTGKWYKRVEGGDTNALTIYLYSNYNTIREIHGRNKIIGLMRSVIITSSRKVTLTGNIITNWSGI